MSKIRLSLTNKQSVDRLLTPNDVIGLEAPLDIDASRGVVISGRAPIWLYAYIVHQLHPTKWIACYDPRLSGGVVVATHSHQASIGQIIIEAKSS